jgi:hypothetical protein
MGLGYFLAIAVNMPDPGDRAIDVRQGNSAGRALREASAGTGMCRPGEVSCVTNDRRRVRLLPRLGVGEGGRSNRERWLTRPAVDRLGGELRGLRGQIGRHRNWLRTLRPASHRGQRPAH